MTWTPLLWILGFVPALIALYFLKLKRRDTVVSSTLLWKRTLEDFRVNAPFQRLRHNWLLLLQLLVLLGLILAAWRPRMQGDVEAGRDLVVLIDNSGSAAAEEPGGRRLDLQKKEALALVGGMKPGDRMTLLSFAASTVPLSPATGDRSLLETRIRQLDGSALPTDLEQALVVAASIAESLRNPEIHVIGDGCYGDLSGLPPEVKRWPVKFLGKGTAVENLAITELDVRKSYEVERRTEVFALVENKGTTAAEVIVALEVEGDLQDARSVQVSEGGSEPVIFDVTAVEEGMARVFIDADDALSLDNEAWVRIRPERTISVLLVGESNPWIDYVLEATSGIEYRRRSLGDMLPELEDATAEEVEESLGADVLIFDRAAPDLEPLLPSIYVDCLPRLPEGLSPPPRVETPVIIDWDRTHPVHRFLVFTDVFIEESFVFNWEDPFRALVDCDEGGIIGVLRIRPPGRKSVPVLMIGFDILQSNWPLGHYSYPIFFANALSWLASSGEEARSSRWRTGEALTYVLRTGESLEDFEGAVFRLPSGRELPPAREAGGRLSLSVAEEVGIYELAVGGQVHSRFPVGLLNRSESRLDPLPVLDFGDFTVEVEDTTTEGGRDLWKWAALLALALLLLEWHAYHRRFA